MGLSRRSVLSGLGTAGVLAAGAATPVSASQIKDLKSLVEKAIQRDGVLALPAGEFSASGIRISGALTITGVPGRTRLISKDGSAVFHISGPEPVFLRGLTFDGGGRGGEGAALLAAQDATALTIEDCAFTASGGSGVRAESCAGRIANCRFSAIGKTAIFSRNAQGLEISGNTILDIGNNAIQVWTSAKGEDGTIVTRNRIARVRADDGGTGQNGNGINIYLAGNVIVSENRVTDCAFSAVRNNAGDDCHIVNNAISRMGEVAIYCEFGFEGAVVAGNIITDVALGISVTNFNDGGRLATVANNVVRRATGGGTLPQTNGVGIGAEGDVAVTGNVVEDTRDTGISLGWGQYSRTLVATGNIVRKTRRGIVFSVAAGADGVLIANNRISEAGTAIVGSDHGEPRTADLGLPGAEFPEGAVITGNLVR